MIADQYRRAKRVAGQGSRARAGGSESDSDGGLVRAMADGEEDALARLWSRHASSLLSYLYGLTGDRDVAEEVVQDTLLAAWRGAARFRGASSVRTWLFAIGRRQALQRLGRDRDVNQVHVDDNRLEALPALEPGPEAVALARADVSAVGVAIGSLSLVHREVLNLIFTHGLSVRDAAQVLGVPVGTIKSRLSNARRALAAVLGEAEEERW